MERTLIFGNAGAGKSTLARRLQARDGRAPLDLDTLAWLPTVPPERRPLEDSRADIEAFMEAHDHWVIEGCYADLLAMAAPRATHMIHLDLPVAECIANAKSRPFEPHKYDTPEAQDANLPMLLAWIEGYETREDACSALAHRALLRSFAGEKERLVTRPD